MKETAKYLVTPLTDGKLQLTNSSDQEEPLVLDAEQVLALRRVLQNPLLPRFNILADRFQHLAEIVQELPVESIVAMNETLTSIANVAYLVEYDAHRLAEQAEAYRVLWKKDA